ncbi:MAG: hypothetical protein ACI88H_001873 [Cocleimonas sp.]|jgi:hypothetical protein
MLFDCPIEVDYLFSSLMQFNIQELNKRNHVCSIAWENVKIKKIKTEEGVFFER